MSDYRILKQDLYDIRAELIEYINHHDESQDLMDLFIKVKQHDEATYELMMLIYQEIKTHQKINKKKTINLISKVIDTKIKTMENIIVDRDKLMSENSGWGEKIWNSLTLKNIMIGLSVWLGVILFFFVLHTINPDAFKAALDENSRLIDKTKTVIKDE